VFTDVAGDPMSPQLTGGTDYVLVLTADGSGPNVYYDTVTNGFERFSYDQLDLTGGFVATITQGRDDTREWNVRCGVEPAAAGDSRSVATYQQQSFSFTSGDTIFGYYVTSRNEEGDTILLGAHKFSSPIVIPQAGTILVSPSIKLG